MLQIHTKFPRNPTFLAKNWKHLFNRNEMVGWCKDLNKWTFVNDTKCLLPCNGFSGSSSLICWYRRKFLCTLNVELHAANTFGEVKGVLQSACYWYSSTIILLWRACQVNNKKTTHLQEPGRSSQATNMDLNNCISSGSNVRQKTIIFYCINLLCQY